MYCKGTFYFQNGARGEEYQSYKYGGGGSIKSTEQYTPQPTYNVYFLTK